MLLHGSCVSRDAAAVLLLGASGAGKSDLVLRLIGRGWVLVADDQVAIEGVAVSAPPALRGMLEYAALGFSRFGGGRGARLVLVVRWRAGRDAVAAGTWAPAAVPRGVAWVRRIAPGMALADAALGCVAQRAGAFAA
jgi:HPr kinase/phosphorylase